MLLAFCRFDQPAKDGGWQQVSDVRAELFDGLRMVWLSPLQRTILVTGSLLMVGAGGLNAVNIFFIDDVLDQPRSYIGLVDGLQGLGFALGALALVPVSARFGIHRLIGPGVLLMGALTLGYARTDLLVPALFLMAFVGLGNGLADTAAQTLIIQRTPPLARGRVISLHATAANASLIGAAGLAGFAAEAAGPRWVVAAAAVAFLVAGASAAFFLRHLPDEAEKSNEGSDDDLEHAVESVVVAGR